MMTNEKKVIVDQITANEMALKSFLEMQQEDILSEVRHHLLGIFRRQVLEIAEENGLYLEWARFFFEVNDTVCKLHPMGKSTFGYFIMFGFIEKFNNLAYGIISDQRPYIEEHRKIIFDKKWE